MAGAGFLPFLGMVLVQVGFAGMNITSKLAMDTGMNPFILVAYRQIFATAGLAPLAFFLERNTRPRITSSTLLQIFLCSILGVTGNQIFYYVGLKNTTTTVGAALNNVLPAITFIFAVFFRLETVGLKSTAGQAKVMGTIVCVCGAMLLSFYRGSVIDIGESHIHWKLTDGLRFNDPSNEGHGFIGPMLIIASCVSWAAWFILQARLSEKFAVPYTSTALMCFMGGIQCTIIAGFSDHSVSAWSLTSNMRLVASIYAGLVGSALAFCLMTWCIQKKGPLYVSVFNPLLLVIVAATNWAFFKEQLYIGTVEGSLLIVAGLYAVLWGKEREAVSKLHEDKEVAKQGQRKDLEMQMTIDYDDIKPQPTTYKESGKGREIDAKF